jgi:hypothetical protein
MTGGLFHVWGIVFFMYVEDIAVCTLAVPKEITTTMKQKRCLIINPHY